MKKTIAAALAAAFMVFGAQVAGATTVSSIQREIAQDRQQIASAERAMAKDAGRASVYRSEGDTTFADAWRAWWSSDRNLRLYWQMALVHDQYRLRSLECQCFPG